MQSPFNNRHRGENGGRSDTNQDSDHPDVNAKINLRDEDGQPPTKKRNYLFYFPHISGCRSLEDYERMELIGEGTYGTVYKSVNKKTSELVALKKIKLNSESEGFPITSIRETITLLKIEHENVINVREVVFGNRSDQIYIVMDYMDRDLRSFIKDANRPFRIEEIKLLMHQLLSAIAHLHDNWILHRDLKTSNLLISKGHLKVGDFGLAREYGSPLKAYTGRVVTLWYRAPELLLQVGKYSTPIDMWSVGCILGELLTMDALFPGESEIKQLELICKALGTPTVDVWPDYERLKFQNRLQLPQYTHNKLFLKLNEEKRRSFSGEGIDLWRRMLRYDPGLLGSSACDMSETRKKLSRITAKDALDHPWFKQQPQAIDPRLFPTFSGKSK